MSKSFQEVFEEWKHDTRYKIGEDIGWEDPDSEKVRPTRTSSSSTVKKDEHTHPA